MAKAISLVQMQPSEDQDCQTREDFKGQLRATLKVYRDAVAELELSSGLDFKKAHDKAEQARLAYETARKSLFEHVAAHGCK